MSNNAVAAYEDGEKPLSKWTKTDIFDAIEKQEVELKCSIEKLKNQHLEKQLNFYSKRTKTRWNR